MEISWTRYENVSSDTRVKYQKSADSIVVAKCYEGLKVNDTWQNFKCTKYEVQII